MSIDLGAQETFNTQIKGVKDPNDLFFKVSFGEWNKIGLKLIKKNKKKMKNMVKIMKKK